MSTVLWSPNAISRAQSDLATVLSVAVGGTITLQMGIYPTVQNVTYTCVTGDTVITAATALAALASASTAPPMFGDATYTDNGDGTITVLASTPGTPYSLGAVNTGGASIAVGPLVLNVSPSDVNNPSNWLRNGLTAIPVNSDIVVVANTAVPMLWNLDLLAAVKFQSYTRFQSMTGQIGLPDQNPLGYREYRPRYFQFSGAGAGSGALSIYLGGGTGGGPQLERYDVGGAHASLYVSGGQAIDFLGGSAANTAVITGANVSIAPLATDVSLLTSATVDGGGSLRLGSGVTVSGTITVSQGSLTVLCACTIVASNGSNVSVQSTGLTYASVTATGGTLVSWQSDSTITALVLKTSSTLDKSQDIRPMVITAADMEGDTCVINDPLSAITCGPITMRGFVSTGPLVLLGTKTFTIT